MKPGSIAIVHDWLTIPGGAEKVFEVLARGFPEADLFTLIHDEEYFSKGLFASRKVTTSFLQALPFAKSNYRYYLFLMMLAVKSLDLTGYDLILSSSHALIHGVRKLDGQVHVNYIHSPFRYAWNTEEMLDLWNLDKGIRSNLASAFFRYIRNWDRAQVKNITYFIANSHWTARLVKDSYSRSSTVIYPPVRTHLFQPGGLKGNHYVVVSRLVPHKRVDLLVEAFNELGLPLIVIGDGPDRQGLERAAKSNIRFLGRLKDTEVVRWIAMAKAFVFAGVEEFGISMAEAQAAGCPVIAFGKGGAAEIVRDGETGFLYEVQSVSSIVKTVCIFEGSSEKLLSPKLIRKNALRFSEEAFLEKVKSYIAQL